ncbi:hypothetical protein [Epizootic haematopoietic necrosis virus]|uniref:Uncharacterized protein n=1 Tax=Epizootic haematopoietic necrosis virus TaxID=100217 RepID=D3TTN9_9VIRU|nr:hypothetical protein ATL82_gp006 [Epizootic haematopoietic necrosis virus]ACO25196.1 hypothetical protein [Epizootic haematopoietic necrosis virus]QNN79815.1 hypothetical protein [Epizootic haematopoietic necrosis virus]QNN79915.1 hypothetical protein [Epizootic haematopoietic necrosis virus]QNN80015.1 hypothetical protein [Epizootic haematopoietic necrosis virus]QNN80214.1 hypothetical protein [Epizootic haematopoietic necrosis virus]
MHTLLFFAVGLLFAGSDVSCSTDSSNSTALSDTALNATAVRNKAREDVRAKLVREKIEISDDEEDECSGCEDVHAGTSQCECTVTAVVSAVVSALSTIIVWCVTLFSANKAGLKKKFSPKKKKSAPPIVLGNVATMDISV